MAKIQFLTSVATFNRTTGRWECPRPEVAALLNAVLHSIGRSINDCMRACESRYHAKVLEWDDEDNEDNGES